MTEQPYDGDDTSGDDGEAQAPNWRRKLEADAKAGREAMAAAEAARAEAAAAKRDLAMARLGIDTERGAGKLFAKAYDGDLDLEAMRTAAEEYGILPLPGTAAATSAIPAEQQQALAAISGARSGAPTGGGAAHDFEAELDAIPMYVPGGGGHPMVNPEYEAKVLEATRAQAAREGREFVVSKGQITAQPGHALHPVTRPLR